MIVPSATQLLRLIETTLDDVVLPGVAGTREQSALATVSHLLRHVAVRIDREGQILTDDIATLKPLLAELASYLADSGDAAGSALAETIRTTLAAPSRSPDIYPSLELVGQDAIVLRTLLQDVLDHLQAVRARDGGRTDYQAARASIRDYLAEQVRAEGTLIHPAFEGKGPRR